MRTVRLLMRQHAQLASLLVLAALCMKLLIPAGFMPMMVDGRITIQVCPGSAPPKASMTMPGMAVSDHGGDHGKAPGPGDTSEVPCAFAGLAAPFTGAIDPVILAIAIAAILALAFRHPDRSPAIAPRLRPPSRAPPALA